MTVRRLPLTLLTCVASATLLASACGGADSTEATTTPATSPASTVIDPTTPSTAAPTQSGFGLPEGYVAPDGWVESVSRFDDGAGIFVESVDDPRLTSFIYMAEGCCDAGLDASFGSPELPTSGSADDLGDGLYLASISSWDPSEPDVATIDVSRVVDCGSPEGADTYFCPVYDLAPGRFEAMESSVPLRLSLDERLTIHIGAALEPVEGDEYSTNYSWLGQGPAFQRFLTDLFDTYSTLVVNPFRSGASLADVSENLYGDDSFRILEITEYDRLGIWQRPGQPALAYNIQDGPLPVCYDTSRCIDSGATLETPRSFESLIARRASLHVANGRMALLFPGDYTGG